MPPVLHRQAEDPRHRRPRGPVREAVRQARHGRPPAIRRQVALRRRRSPPLPGAGGRRSSCPADRAPAEPSGEAAADEQHRRSSRSTTLLAEHAELEQRARRPGGARRPGAGPPARPALRRARPGRRDRTARWRRPAATSATARELAGEDASFAAEAGRAGGRRSTSSPAGCASCCCPATPTTTRTSSSRSRRGRAATESALFAGDLLRMYLRYAERRGWKTEVLDADRVRPRRLQGRRRRGQGAGHAEPATASGRRLKYEGGVHRVQRVPVTESQGRIHTSRRRRARAARGRGGRRRRSTRTTCASTSSARPGPGGQSVNTTDSAVRITHLPTGIVGQLPEREEPAAEQGAGDAHPARPAARRRPGGGRRRTASDARRSQVRTVDRSERIRTYNFPENRIADHRVGYKAYNLDQVLDGDLDAVIDALRRRAHTGRAAGGRRPETSAGGRCWPTPRAGWPTAGVESPRVRRRAAARPRRSGVPRRLLTAGRRAGRRRAAGSTALRRPAGRPRAAAAPHRAGALPAPRARGRARGLRAAAGDRAARRLGARAAAPGRDGAGRRRPVHRVRRDRAGGRHEVPARGCTPSSATPARSRGPGTTPRPRRGGRHPGRPAAGRHGRPGLLPELDGTVDVVVCNPPYIPTAPAVPREVADHDPPLALWAGAGRARRRPRAARAAAARLLRPGGVVGVEHADVQGSVGCRRVFAAHGGWTDVADHPDLAGRDRASPPPGAAATMTVRERLLRRGLRRLYDMRRPRPSAPPASTPPRRRSGAASWSCCPPTPSTAWAPTRSRRPPSAALLAAKGRGRDMPVPVLVGTPRTLDGLATDLSAGGPGPGRGVLARRA